MCTHTRTNRERAAPLTTAMCTHCWLRGAHRHGTHRLTSAVLWRTTQRVLAAVNPQPRLSPGPLFGAASLHHRHHDTAPISKPHPSTPRPPPPTRPAMDSMLTKRHSQAEETHAPMSSLLESTHGRFRHRPVGEHRPILCRLCRVLNLETTVEQARPSPMQRGSTARAGHHHHTHNALLWLSTASIHAICLHPFAHGPLVRW